jgi:hypothetical protein
MGRKLRPIVASLAHILRFRKARQKSKNFYDFIATMHAVSYAFEKGKLTEPVAALHALYLLAKHGPRERFDWDMFTKYVFSFNERLIPVPESLLYSIGNAWGEYILNPEIEMEVAFQAKGKRGTRQARTVIKNLSHSFQLASYINQERIWAKYPNIADLHVGEDITLEEAIYRVLIRFEGEQYEISERLLQRAWNQWGGVIQDLTDSQIKAKE